jgi:hypothetical protein
VTKSSRAPPVGTRLLRLAENHANQSGGIAL